MTPLQLPVKNTEESNTKLIRFAVASIGLSIIMYLLMGGNLTLYAVFIILLLLAVICRKKFILSNIQISKMVMTDEGFLVYGFKKEVLRIPFNKVNHVSKSLSLYVDFSGIQTTRYTLKLSNTYYFGDELILGYKFFENETPMEIELIKSYLKIKN